MKHVLFLVAALVGGSVLFAQNDCSKNHPIYNMDKSAPKSVYKLGSNPEFPFLRNLRTPKQVLAALKSPANRKKYPRQMKEIDRMLREIGFENGAKSVTLSSVSSTNVPPGATGNMGGGQMHYSYVKMKGTQSHKAWVISAGNGCYVSFFSKCGNAFYAGDNFGANKTGTFTGCKEVPVSINSDEKEITIADEPVRHVITKTYIYYVKHSCPCTDCSDPNEIYDRSKPLLVKKEDVAEQVPVTYKVTTTGTGTATVCKGKTTDVHADINVEKESEYTGYRPSETKKEFIRVSKREYKRTLRLKSKEYTY